MKHIYPHERRADPDEGVRVAGQRVSSCENILIVHGTPQASLPIPLLPIRLGNFLNVHAVKSKILREHSAVIAAAEELVKVAMLLNGGEQKRHQDRDDDQQLDERKSRSFHGTPSC